MYKYVYIQFYARDRRILYVTRRKKIVVQQMSRLKFILKIITTLYFTMDRERGFYLKTLALKIFVPEIFCTATSPS